MKNFTKVIFLGIFVSCGVLVAKDLTLIQDKTKDSFQDKFKTNKEIKDSEETKRSKKSKEFPPNSRASIASSNSKNGFFIGIEGDLGGLNISEGYSRLFLEGLKPPYDDGIILDYYHTTFDLGLVGGYQYYFGENKQNGIKISAHLYSGFGNNNLHSKTIAGEWNERFEYFIHSYIPVKLGLEVKYLYDFFQRGKHTLGLNAGVGYQVNWYLNGKFDGLFHDNDDSSKTTLLSKDPTMTSAPEEFLKEIFKLKNNFTNGLYPVIGLHYYYAHHQFELMYRFGGIWHLSSKTQTHLLGLLEYNLNSSSYATFNYTYRF